MDTLIKEPTPEETFAAHSSVLVDFVQRGMSGKSVALVMDVFSTAIYNLAVQIGAEGRPFVGEVLVNLINHVMAMDAEFADAAQTNLPLDTTKVN